MKWEEARAIYPHQWLLVEALDATTRDGKRIIDELAIINQYEDGQEAWQAYAALHAQNPQREMLVLHTQREELDITVKQWVGLRGIMTRISSNHDEIPIEFNSLEQAGEFWDTHCTADYEDLLEPVDVEIALPKQQDKSKHLAP